MSWPPRASEQRRSAYTDAEIRLFRILNKHRIFPLAQKTLKFTVTEDQRLMEKFIIPDFIIREKVVVEVDGDIHEKAKNKHKDEERDRILKDNGFTVLRFTNRDVFDDEDGVMNAIWEAMRQVG